VPSPADDVVGKLNTPLTVKFKAGTILPVIGVLILKLPPYYTYAKSSYEMFGRPLSVSSSIISITETFFINSETEGTITLKYKVNVLTTGIYGLDNSKEISFVI
jgi:hypothetical protein